MKGDQKYDVQGRALEAFTHVCTAQYEKRSDLDVLERQQYSISCYARIL